MGCERVVESGVFGRREGRFLVGRGAEVGVWVGPKDRLGWTKAADMGEEEDKEEEEVCEHLAYV